MLKVSDMEGMFPNLPKASGEYKTIFIEPIALSGERIAACAIARLSTGEHKVMQAIPSATLICMYGAQAKAMEGLIRTVINDANAWLDNKLPLSEYQPPFSNTFSSEAYTLNADSVDQVLKASIQNTASLAPVNFEEEEPEVVETRRGSGGLAKRFVAKVKGSVIDLSPNLSKNFNVKIGGMHKYHFIGNGYAANLGAMNPAMPYNSVNEAKRLLWDLAVVDQYDWTIEDQELIIYMPEDDNITYSKKQYQNAKDTLARFEDEADQKSIRLITTSSSVTARDRLIKAA